MRLLELSLVLFRYNGRNKYISTSISEDNKSTNQILQRSLQGSLNHPLSQNTLNLARNYNALNVPADDDDMLSSITQNDLSASASLKYLHDITLCQEIALIVLDTLQVSNNRGNKPILTLIQ